MLNKKRILVISSLLGLSVCLLGSFSHKSHACFAGASKIPLANQNSIGKNNLNSGDFISDGEISVNDYTLYLKDNASIISTGYVRNLKDYGCEATLDGNFDVSLSELGNFAITFGLPSVRSEYKCPGSLEMSFSNLNDLYMLEIVAYYSDSVVTTVYEKNFILDIQQDKYFNIHFNFSCDRNLTVSINDTNLVENKFLPGINGEGYFSVYTSGNGSDVAIKNFDIYAFQYEITENIEYLETFDKYEKDAYNSNVFYSESYQSLLPSSYLAVRKNDESGNRYLHFSNTADAFISTQRQYSNFQLDFDLLDITRTVKKDENGNILNYISQWFGIGFGLDDVRQGVDARACRFLQFEGMRDNASSLEILPDPRFVFYDSNLSAVRVENMKDYVWLWNPEFDGTTFNIRFSMVDGLASLWIKQSSDEAFCEMPLLTADYGSTPLGYVRIFTWGERNVSSFGPEYNGICNIKIDNISIKNLDYEGVKKVVAVEDKESGIAETPDFEYNTLISDEDLLSYKIENNLLETKDNSILLVILIPIGIVLVGGSVTLFILLKRKKKHE